VHSFSAWRIGTPLTTILMGYQGANAYDRVVNLFGKFVTHCSPNFISVAARTGNS
jgi:hypothetical protein